MTDTSEHKAADERQEQLDAEAGMTGREVADVGDAQRVEQADQALATEVAAEGTGREVSPDTDAEGGTGEFTGDEIEAFWSAYDQVGPQVELDEYEKSRRYGVQTGFHVRGEINGQIVDERNL